MTSQTKAAKLKDTMKLWRNTQHKGKAALDELKMLDKSMKCTGNRLNAYSPEIRFPGDPLPKLSRRPTLICNIDAQSVQGSFAGWMEHRLRVLVNYDFSHNDKNDVEDAIRDAKLWGKQPNHDNSGRHFWICAWDV